MHNYNAELICGCKDKENLKIKELKNEKMTLSHVIYLLIITFFNFYI